VRPVTPSPPRSRRHDRRAWLPRALTAVGLAVGVLMMHNVSVMDTAMSTPTIGDAMNQPTAGMQNATEQERPMSMTPATMATASSMSVSCMGHPCEAMLRPSITFELPALIADLGTAPSVQTAAGAAAGVPPPRPPPRGVSPAQLCIWRT
jgi:hypothetical protein